MFFSKYGVDKHVVESVAIICGTDILVYIGGGTHYHIGATTLGINRPSHLDVNKSSASVSVLCADSHKDDELAKEASYQISSLFNCKTSVSVGIHIDNATKDDIQLLYNNYKKVLEDIIKQIKKVHIR